MPVRAASQLASSRAPGPCGLVSVCRGGARTGTRTRDRAPRPASQPGAGGRGATAEATQVRWPRRVRGMAWQGFGTRVRLENGVSGGMEKIWERDFGLGRERAAVRETGGAEAGMRVPVSE
jgi:hypothetical protein